MISKLVGVALIVVGGYLIARPEVTAELLGKTASEPTQWINMRASWGGTLLGLGAFVVWLPALRPLARTIFGLLMWAMAGIGLARLVGFAIDGSPDTRQWIWITAEVAIVIGCWLGLRVMARAAATRERG